ncbi:Predicted ATPase [Lutibacter oricola]|uniref:Predicted ATPase n=1 Tax=Lutibacter oricola TaxID=762486 RepID=A0A1H2VS42_9FLAO|nr:ATP-binding protein [Lutibacter oricola]SDW71057.1 Predicted ATPase [Lutibacter oricola]
MQNKIVITGGPGTGKSTVIEELIYRKYECMKEISREVTLNARKNGTDQLFLTKPLLFSELLLEGRVNQYVEAEKKNKDIVFFDRGIPDVHAYMNYISIDYPDTYIQKSKLYKYNYIFLMPPWEEIYISDSERYENFEQALAIHNHLERTYKELGYKIIEVPFGTVEFRADFILEYVK